MDEIHYSEGRAERYVAHHEKSLRTRLTSFRERQCLHQALELGQPYGAVLDLPCGTGRFVPAFQGIEFDCLTAADNSPGMLEIAAQTLATTPFEYETKLLSAFAIDVPDNAFDFVACMRFFHHLARSEDRLQVLGELRRISTGPVALSLWVDGNLGALRRQRRQSAAGDAGFGRRRLLARSVIEAEFHQAGFRVVRHWDMWPKLTMWRQYLLQVV